MLKEEADDIKVSINSSEDFKILLQLLKIFSNTQDSMHGSILQIIFFCLVFYGTIQMWHHTPIATRKKKQKGSNTSNRIQRVMHTKILVP